MNRLAAAFALAAVAGARALLESLTGAIDTAYIAKPELPENGLNTPGPDPS